MGEVTGLGIGAATSPALKTNDALVRRQASMLTAVVVFVMGSRSSQVLAVWKIQHGFVSNHLTASGFHLGKTPNLDLPDGSYETTGSFFARFRGSRERGRSMITVCVNETPKSCIIFADLMPGMGAFAKRGAVEEEACCVLGIIE